MRLLIAPDKFKGTLTAKEAASAIAAGATDENITTDFCPISDGGEGFVDALVSASRGRLFIHRVIGPLPEMHVDAPFGILGDGTTAVIEMSAASGLALLRPDQRDPLATTTFGAGQLICRAVELGCKRILLGIGGSATNDAGIGCAQACGLPVILEDGEPVSPTEPLCGRDVERVVLIKHGRGSPVEGIPITVACDVNNPLFGPNGAATIYGPQKGADPATIDRLDAALEQLARRNNKLEVAMLAGAGAAGGLGFGLAAFFGAILKPGFDIVADAVNLAARVRAADLCLTGEGCLDQSSTHGKVIAGLAALCDTAGIPCIALCGAVADPLPKIRGLTAAIGIWPKPGITDETRTHSASQLTARARTAINEALARFNPR